MIETKGIDKIVQEIKITDNFRLPYYNFNNKLTIRTILSKIIIFFVLDHFIDKYYTAQLLVKNIGNEKTINK